VKHERKEKARSHLFPIHIPIIATNEDDAKIALDGDKFQPEERVLEIPVSTKVISVFDMFPSINDEDIERLFFLFVCIAEGDDLLERDARMVTDP